MGLVNEKTAAEIADGVRAAKSAAQSALGEQMERRKQRIKSVSKTRKSRATRERIMTAASGLMVERGNTDFQMSEVSARCHMSKGALYYYFSDKDELVEAVFEASGDELVSAIEEAVSQAASAREALESLFSELARRMRTRSPLVLALTVELSSMGGELFSAVSGQLSRIVRIIGELLERGKGEGFVRQDVDTSLAAVYLCGGLVGTTVASASGVMQGSEAMGLSLMELLAHGVAPLGLRLRRDDGQAEGDVTQV
ncbi:TetR/AcrR family transcriptional regulator [Parafannyhessea umbonata]|uniref:TetR/AcrR family transcriptional regulator n=1 Tax=Parafannyhessea umbonata TaxID=604330 RepID=UPI0026E9880F|nr:TetR/AcrR family transcriptional regulator [Parafannyhessea umbonata]MDD7199215.1 TetR/AcrR family transcriptional regulator [Parafannyhessea umbonata]MDY4417909.1 TetR/AcrR family transcriptional regulator [Parafannyhessea umbonata]